ncbi:hypothetical protein PITCH_A1260010 [uncultured Desulfobacterium sp.]|uniref:Uncharacterized protein n=1 Tax=uncultured Desulfobacterium sp. TaxID=201089 RepID=A0A445MRU2_9BACT|nr:hypothetical protein PITCH_A1260010 [uncultured Desulfobacterium sp.]
MRKGEKIQMLVIRDDQMDVFKDYMAKRFEKQMIRHVNQYFPDDCKALGQAKVREVLAYGLIRAETYEMSLEYDVSRYINLMFTFGRDYDVDIAWASGILGDKRLSGPEKMDDLYEEAERHINEAVSIGKRPGESKDDLSL